MSFQTTPKWPSDQCMQQLREGALYLADPVASIQRIFCGCGDLEASWDLILSYLLARLNRRWRELTPSDQIMAYLLDYCGITEHGNTIRCSWLTDEGMILLGFLLRWGPGWDDMAWWVDSEGITHGQLP